MTPSPDLDRIRVRFATFRDRSPDERTADAARFDTIPTAERVLLDTCHRVELISVDDAPLEGGAHGTAAVRRVFEVVGGLDSAVVAEEQLLGQARAAYEAALAAGTSGPLLNELFRRALRFGRRVRSQARPGSDRSLADRGAGWLLERLGPNDAALVAGTGAMGSIVASRLAEAGHGVTVASTSADRGDRLRRQLPGRGHRLVVGPLEPRHLDGHAALALAVRSRSALIGPEHLASVQLKAVLDLSTPGAVAPEAARMLGERLLDVDRLGSIVGRESPLTPAVERRLRHEIEAEVDAYVDWLAARPAADALRLLHAGADAVRRRHLERLRRRLPANELRAVEAAATAMVGELLHGPTLALRRGDADAATVRRLFGLDA